MIGEECDSRSSSQPLVPPESTSPLVAVEIRGDRGPPPEPADRAKTGAGSGGANSARREHYDGPTYTPLDRPEAHGAALQKFMWPWPVFFIIGGALCAVAILSQRLGFPDASHWQGVPPGVGQGSISFSENASNSSYSDGQGSIFDDATAELVEGLDRTMTVTTTTLPPKPLGKHAFVMIAYTPPEEQPGDIIWGALAVARQLQIVSKYPLVMLTNTTYLPDGTELKSVALKLDIYIRPVYEVKESTGALPYKRWFYAFWKLQVWTLTEFEKLIWLDADSVVTRSIDWLFDRDWMYAQRDDWFCTNPAPKVCSGLMLLFPNMTDFEGMLSYASEIGPTLTDGDQQLIRRYFLDVRKKPLKLLSPLEAAFGQCILGASPFQTEHGTLQGFWSLPTFVHKSGGWNNDNGNIYINQCFTHNLQLQLYVVGTSYLNVCHFHPAAHWWRQTFCEALRILQVETERSRDFCDDGVYWHSSVRELPEPFYGEQRGMPEIEDGKARVCTPQWAHVDENRVSLQSSTSDLYMASDMLKRVSSYDGIRHLDYFQMLHNQDGTISLQDSFCNFVAVEVGSAIVMKPGITNEAKFDLKELGDGKVALKSQWIKGPHNFVIAQASGKFSASGAVEDAEAQFTLVHAPTTTLTTSTTTTLTVTSTSTSTMTGTTTSSTTDTSSTSTFTFSSTTTSTTTNTSTTTTSFTGTGTSSTTTSRTETTSTTSSHTSSTTSSTRTATATTSTSTRTSTETATRTHTGTTTTDTRTTTMTATTTRTTTSTTTITITTSTRTSTTETSTTKTSTTETSTATTITTTDTTTTITTTSTTVTSTTVTTTTMTRTTTTRTTTTITTTVTTTTTTLTTTTRTTTTTQKNLASPENAEPVHLFYKPEEQAHTYHFDGPRDGELWADHEPQFFAFRHHVPGTLPITEFWNRETWEHTYHLLPPWSDEETVGTAFFAFVTERRGTLPVYDFWDPASKEHTFHMGLPWAEEERNHVQFYAYPRTIQDTASYQV